MKHDFICKQVIRLVGADKAPRLEDIDKFLRLPLPYKSRSILTNFRAIHSKIFLDGLFRVFNFDSPSYQIMLCFLFYTFLKEERDVLYDAICLIANQDALSFERASSSPCIFKDSDGLPLHISMVLNRSRLATPVEIEKMISVIYQHPDFSNLVIRPIYKLPYNKYSDLLRVLRT